ncbi:MAG TPA: YbhB/YbcL family Raf kinase inhibitor-like protein, partial [Dyella sp.]|nr:YbhB/YbcL family Raf kinase inhibitor-like protein [Dyella sp.]
KTSSYRASAGAFALLLQVAMAAAASSPASLHVASSSFSDGGNMPLKLTCDGSNLSPDIQLPPPPAGTRSFAIVVNDPDAPTAFTHWLAYNIPADARDLPEGTSTRSHRLIRGAEGINSFGTTGYSGPCPPVGSTHHYVFRVYALDVNPALPPGVATNQVETAIEGHVLAEGEITGLYTRGG